MPTNPRGSYTESLYSSQKAYPSQGANMGNPAITLSLSDPAGQTMLPLFKEHGFKETPTANILKKNNTYLFVIQHLIVPEERFRMPPEPRPYPADYTQQATQYDLDYIVVASRHWSKGGKPSLTMHPTGNFGKAMYGGRPRQLQLTAPNPMRNIYTELTKNPPEQYSLSLEATHHSPTQFKVPMFFAEIGSREEQWRDQETCSYLVDAILKGIEKQETAPTAIGFGGGHYCPSFSVKMQENSFGHMAAKYTLQLLTKELVDQMIGKTPGAERAYLDSGLKRHEKNKIIRLMEDHDLEIID